MGRDHLHPMLTHKRTEGMTVGVGVGAWWKSNEKE